MANRIGQRLGNYHLIRLLGEGGFAEVYLGEHIHLGIQAAIKVLHTQLATDDLDTFRTEAHTIAQLKHHHIVGVFDFDLEDGVPFLVMDYASNGTLRKRHPKGELLSLTTILPYVKQVADALQYAHDNKLIHRDIKPENMLLGRNDDVLLSDFGIAVVAHSTKSMSLQKEAGTLPYMAPEQIQGKARPASDQYALGVVVYEWLSGTVPFRGSSYWAIATQHISAPPPPLREKVPSILPEVERIVMTALAKEPQQRFANVDTFASALEQAYLIAQRHSLSLPAVKLSPDQSLQSTYVSSTPSQSWQPTYVPPLPSQSPQSSITPTSTNQVWQLAQSLWPVSQRTVFIAMFITISLLIVGFATLVPLLGLIGQNYRNQTPSVPPMSSPTLTSNPSLAPSQQTLTVPPNLVGNSLAAAEDVLNKAVILYEVLPAQPASDPTKGPNIITKVDPPSNTPIDSGTVIKLYVVNLTNGTPMPTPDPGFTYCDQTCTTNGFSVEHPSNWRQGTTNDGTGVQFTNPSTQDQYAAFKVAGSTSATANQLVNTDLQHNFASKPGYTPPTSSQATTIGGVTWAYSTATYDLNGQTERIQVYATVRQGKSYIIELNAADSDFDTVNTKYFEPMLGSFQFQ